MRFSIQNRLKNSGVIYILLLMQLMLLFILPSMDGRMNKIRILIYTLFACLSVATVLMFLKENWAKKGINVDGSFLCVVGFIVLCAISALWGISRGTPISDVVRGILPFTWFCYIVIITQALQQKQIENMIRLIGWISIFYALRIITYYMVYVFGHPYQRVTFHLIKATSMIPMVGSLILGFFYIRKKNKNKKYLFGTLVCFIAVMLTETKSMLMALVGGWIVLGICVVIYVRKKGVDKKKLVRKVLIVECCLLACMVILMAGTNLGKRWKTMVSISDNNGSIEGNEAEEPEKIVTVDEGSVSVRIIELKMAVKSFINSPIFGQGIGYRWQADGLDYGGPVLYMHNILAYILMDFGILGAAYIIIILVAIIRMNAKMLKKSNGKIEDGGVFLLSFSVIAMAFVYANFFAVFRSIEFVIICSVFFAAMAVEYKKYDRIE